MPSILVVYSNRENLFTFIYKKAVLSISPCENKPISRSILAGVLMSFIIIIILIKDYQIIDKGNLEDFSKNLNKFFSYFFR